MNVEVFFEILKDKNHSRAFVVKLDTYTQLKFIQENYSFLQEAYSFKRAPTQDAAEKLYKKWVEPSPGASMFEGDPYINIEGETLEKIKKILGIDQETTGKLVIQKITPKGALKTMLGMVFDEAIEHIEYIFRTDTFGTRRKTYVPPIKECYDEFTKIARTLKTRIEKIKKSFRDSGPAEFFTPN